MQIFFFFKETYGSRRASHRRRIACGESRERYPFLRCSVRAKTSWLAGLLLQSPRADHETGTTLLDRKAKSRKAAVAMRWRGVFPSLRFDSSGALT